MCVGARPWGGGGSGGRDLLPAWLPGSGSLPQSVLPCLSPRLRPPRLGEDAATHVALEVGPRTLRRLSGCPLAAPTPWGSPLRPPGVPPSAASAPAPPPCPCVRSRLSLAHSQTPILCPQWPPPSLCLSVWVTSEADGQCVCLRKGQAGDSLSGRLLAPSCLATSHLQAPPPTPPLSNTGGHTHIHTRIHAPPHFPGIPLNTPGA